MPVSSLRPRACNTLNFAPLGSWPAHRFFPVTITAAPAFREAPLCESSISMHPKFPPVSRALAAAFALALAFAPIAARGQAEPPPYGVPLSLAQARIALAAAQAEAEANGWRVAIAIVDSGGHLVLFERADSTQYGSAEVAIAKARTSSAFRRPSKAFQDHLAAGGEGLRLLGLTGAMPIDGGLPLVWEGKIVGAIGVSGVTSAQDGQIAAAGAAALGRLGAEGASAAASVPVAR